MPRPARTLPEHEDELWRRAWALMRLTSFPESDLGELRAAAMHLRSGCDAYMRRLDVADASERRSDD